MNSFYDLTLMTGIAREKRHTYESEAKQARLILSSFPIEEDNRAIKHSSTKVGTCVRVSRCCEYALNSTYC